jgi:homopolymeric O-antigen transport system ATP-binding protein
MSDVVVQFERVWKKFRRGERHDSLRDLLPSVAGRLLRRHGRCERGSDDGFWALKDVSFEVRRGEALGIIGPNGAGKSTTLKLLTRILRPSRGSSRVVGRVGALIEVAAGFHPDLTGRENVYLQGAIMGMKRREVSTRLDEIVAFAGVADFIDTQIKRYSSGMSARLGFSIAAHLNPDVLIIDEVLSVGDMAFQRRCVERMEDFKRQGVAIVFVSHQLQAVATLCGQALYLQQEVRAIGPTPEVIKSYVENTDTGRDARTGATVDVQAEGVLDASGRPVTVISPGATLTFCAAYHFHQDISNVQFGLLVYRSTDGLLLYAGSIDWDEIGPDRIEANETIRASFVFKVPLARGQYHLECDCYHPPTGRHLARLVPAGAITVEEQRIHSGIVDLEMRAMVQREHQGRRLLASTRRARP